MPSDPRARSARASSSTRRHQRASAIQSPSASSTPARAQAARGDSRRASSGMSGAPATPAPSSGRRETAPWGRWPAARSRASIRATAPSAQGAVAGSASSARRAHASRMARAIAAGSSLPGIPPLRGRQRRPHIARRAGGADPARGASERAEIELRPARHAGELGRGARRRSRSRTRRRGCAPEAPHRAAASPQAREAAREPSRPQHAVPRQGPHRAAPRRRTRCPRVQPPPAASEAGARSRESDRVRCRATQSGGHARRPPPTRVSREAAQAVDDIRDERGAAGGGDLGDSRHLAVRLACDASELGLQAALARDGDERSLLLRPARTVLANPRGLLVARERPLARPPARPTRRSRSPRPRSRRRRRMREATRRRAPPLGARARRALLPVGPAVPRAGETSGGDRREEPLQATMPPLGVARNGGRRWPRSRRARATGFPPSRHRPPPSSRHDHPAQRDVALGAATRRHPRR